MRRQSLIVCWAVFASFAYQSQVEADGEDGGTGTFRKHHGPPPEAFQACNELEEGAACSFTHHEHQISGMCRAGTEGKPALCVPNHPPHGAFGYFGPLPEALQACSGLEQGAPCNFTRDGNQVTGTCRSRPGKPAACRPSHSAPQS
jgi:hypothetical protein